MNKPPRLPNWSIFNRFSIRSKLQAIILLACLISILLTGLISYTTAKNALKQSIYDELTALRARQAYTLADYFERVTREINTYSGLRGVRQAFKGLKAAYRELENKPLSPQQEQQLRDFYQTEVLTKLKSISVGEPLVDPYLPKSQAAKYLQTLYLVNNPNPIGQKKKLNNPNDSSQYSKIHSEVHPNYRNFAELFDYYDVFMIDPDSGEIIYSMSKEIDLGTNLKTGIYSNSNLAKVFNEVLKSQDPNFVATADFENYRPSFDRPAAFIATSIYDNSELIGVLAFQVSIERINKIMTVNQKWREVGLNQTGESLFWEVDQSSTEVKAEDSRINQTEE